MQTQTQTQTQTETETETQTDTDTDTDMGCNSSRFALMIVSPISVTLMIVDLMIVGLTFVI